MGAHHTAITASVAALLALAMLAPSAIAEIPPDGTCDDTGLLACAHGAAGGNVTCTKPTQTTVSCGWTVGHNWATFSNVEIPGTGSASWEQTVEICIAGLCEAAAASGTDPTCTWAPAMYCGDDGLELGSLGPIELQLGECVQVTVERSVTVVATAPAAPLPGLASATYTATGSDAGAECVLDDGRP